MLSADTEPVVVGIAHEHRAGSPTIRVDSGRILPDTPDHESEVRSAQFSGSHFGLFPFDFRICFGAEMEAVSTTLKAL
jgi:hypothetical protein